MAVPDEILKRALTLDSAQKAELISSLSTPDQEIDELWAEEAEGRIDAFERGKIKAVELDKVLEKLK